MRTLLRILIILIVIVAVLLGGLTGFVLYTTRRMLPQVSGTLTLPGLEAPVTIYRDQYGVPHIYATTAHDLFFAQGVVHAQDRWWQLEFNRHTGLGRIGELTGDNPTVRRNDIFIRTVGWNRAAEADLAALSPDTRGVLEAFSRGVNAYIEGKPGADLAVEYSVLGLTGVSIPVAPWEPLHSIVWAKVMAWGLSGNMDAELTAADLIGRLGADGEQMVFGYYNGPYPDRHPTILTGDDLPVAPQMAGRLPRPPLVTPGTDLRRIQTQLIGAPPELGKDTGLGSNNWVISGKLTESGLPLLANDTHLGIQMPSIWYQNGLHCVEVTPECPYDVVGFTFPGVPGVVIGHNRHIAWGVTNGALDTQDLYIIKVDPEDDTRYEVDGQMLDMEVITETIRFGDGTPPLDLRVRMTRFGPIITDTPSYEDSYDRPLALKWAAISEPGDLLGSVLAINRAQDWEGFRSALTQWLWPSQNFVYADTAGNIGYQLPGLIPIRAGEHSGLTPVDGATTAYDWKGFIPFEHLPRLFNPARGYIVTANHAIVPEAYYAGLAEALGERFGAESNYRISYQWDYGYRARRIVDLIEAGGTHTVQTMASLQADVYDGTAAEILPFALRLDYGNQVPAEVIEWMKGWDYRKTMESGQAALYAAFWAQLTEKLWADQTGFTPGGSNISAGTYTLLNQPDHRWWDDVTTPDKQETRDDILRSAFIAAYNSLLERLGSDYQKWQWGGIHTARFVSNPLGASGIDLIERFVNAGPVAVGGSTETVSRTAWSPGNPFGVQSISSQRIINDLSDFDNNLWIHTTGQSGHPTSAHYRDQIDSWRLVEYQPMRWSREAIAREAIATLTLQPK